MPRANPRRIYSTGVPGLDDVLGGGLREGSLYLVFGPSGAGKTILGAQIAFNAAREGRVLVVTLIAESHAKLLDHLGGLAFFDEQSLTSRISLINGFEALREGGGERLLAMLAALTARDPPRLLVLEGFGTLRALKLSELDIVQFIHQLNALMTSLSCTALIVDPASSSATSPEQSLVDGIVELSYLTQNGRVAREIQVHKHRAANPMLGRNVFRIDDAGIRVYPRLDTAVVRRLKPPAETSERARFGVEHLDTMTQGGLVRGASTLILGPPGSGKTLLGLQFLHEGIRQRERSLYFGFYESPQRLLAKAAGVGLHFGQAANEGSLRVVWQPPLDFTIEELIYRLLDEVRRLRPSRLVIDGFEGFQQSAIRKERIAMFMTALTTDLRAMGIDVLLTQETGLLRVSDPRKDYVVSALVENIILLRYVEANAQLHRLVSIVKMRESEYDTSIRELKISGKGLDVSPTFASAAVLLHQQPWDRDAP